MRARDRLVQLYLPLVEAFAHRYGRRGAEVEDLIQVGSIGLLGAIDRFDAKRGEDFTAFAVPTIAGEIKRHLRDRTGAVNLPRRLRDASMRLPQARQRLTARLGRVPEPAELAADLGVAESELAVIEQSGRPPDDDATETSGPEVDLDDRILLAGAFQALDDTERSIVYLRFVRELSRRDTAKQLGMTEDRLRRRTQAALAKLRGELERSAFPGAPARAPEAEPEPAAEVPEEAKSPAPAAGKTRNGGEHSGRLLVRMPPTLHDDLARAAEREEVSLNQFITNALSSAVGWQQGKEPSPPETPPRWLPAAIVTNIVVLALAGAAAVALLVVAWQQGF